MITMICSITVLIFVSDDANDDDSDDDVSSCNGNAMGILVGHFGLLLVIGWRSRCI
jgi:hypothetical protein